MSDFIGSKFNRRGVLKSSMAVMAGGLLSRYSLEKAAAETEPAVKNVNLNSSPSTLKITDMRYAIIVKPGPSPCPIIRIDTNQGVYGLGEVRDVAGYQYAMVLKNRIVGENPLEDRLSVSEDPAVWRHLPPGRRRLRHRDGALGHRGQGLQHVRCTRCLAANGGIRSASMPIRPSRMTRKSTEGGPRNARRWGLPG
jgi:hypothetical protein